VNSPYETRRRAPIVPGIVLILLGLWLLGRQLNLPVFVGDVLWPWVFVGVGLLIWAHYIFLPPRSADEPFWGTAAVPSGVFLLGWRNGYFLSNFEGWASLWPIVPLIAGISALVKWVFAIRDWGSLVTGIAFAAVGIVGLGYNMGSIDAATAWQISRYWPILVVLAGLGVLIQAVQEKSSGH
jgi:hypothetical protein